MVDRQPLASWNDGATKSTMALDRAHDYGITVVSMKRDWRVVF
jgi:hypothetical protein